MAAVSRAVLEDLILVETVRLVSTASGPDRDAYGRLVRHVRERFAEAWMIGQRLTATLQIPEHRSGAVEDD